MSQHSSKPLSVDLLSKPLLRAAPPLPSPSTPETVCREGTRITLFFLAAENFANRYQAHPFLSDSVSALRTLLKTISNNEISLYHQIRQFVVDMPLDAIAASSHPKKLKQIILETLLNPTILTTSLIQTEKQTTSTAIISNLVRDLQYYSKLCEISPDGLKAREMLIVIMQTSPNFKGAERKSLYQAIAALPFTHPTDRNFCLQHLEGSGIISLKPAQVVTHPARTLPSPAPDFPLRAILIFQQFEQLTQEIVAQAGETLESIQNRAKTQQLAYQEFIANARLIPARDKEVIHQSVISTWPKFIRGIPSREKRFGTFLNFLANTH